MSKRGELGQAIKGHNISKTYNLKSLGAPKFKAPDIVAATNEAPAQVEKSGSMAETPQSQSELEMPAVARGSASAPYKVSKGYFRLNHAIWTDERLDIPGDAFRLFLWMLSRAWGFKDSDGLLVASHSFMEVGARISRAGVARAIQTLVSRGLIERLELSEKKHGRSGMTYRVSPLGIPKEEFTQNKNAQTDRAGSGLPRSEGSVASNREISSIHLRDQFPQIEGQIKTLQESIKNSHTPCARKGELAENRIEELGSLKYLREIKAPRQRDVEQQAYVALLASYKASEIDQAYELINRDPHLFTEEKIYSPMAFLARAMDSVMNAVRTEEAVRSRREFDQVKYQLASEEEARLETEYLQGERLFLTKFPSEEEQEAEIDRILHNELVGIGKLIRRKVAIQRFIREGSKR